MFRNSNAAAASPSGSPTTSPQSATSTPLSDSRSAPTTRIATIRTANRNSCLRASASRAKNTMTVSTAMASTSHPGETKMIMKTTSTTEVLTADQTARTRRRPLVSVGSGTRR